MKLENFEAGIKDEKVMRRILPVMVAAVLALGLALAGCSTNDNGSDGIAVTTDLSEPSDNMTTQAAATEEDTTQIDNFDFSLSDRDQDPSYDEEAATVITFNSDNQVETITQDGTYIVRGSSEGGQLIVDLTNVKDPENAKAQVVLDGLTLVNTSAPALLVAQADKVFITLAEGSTNTLSDGSGRTDLAADDAATDDITESANENATLYSHDDLTINGSGALIVSSANHHGIKCQDDLAIVDGIIAVTSGKDGIRGKDSVKIAGGTITIQSGDDGIYSNQTDSPYEKGFVNITGGETTINAAGDGIKGQALARLADGRVTVESSYEGIEACLVWLEGGAHSITSDDDGVNAAGDIRVDFLINITGGTFYIDAEGDGLDSNVTLTQSGGTVVVAGPTLTFDNGALDAEHSAVITGGSMLAMDDSGMPAAFDSDSAQCTLLYSMNAPQVAGTRITLVDGSGTALFSFVAPKSFSNVAYSSPQLTTGESYSFVVGGEVSGGSAVAEHESVQGGPGFDFIEGGTMNGGEAVTAFTLSERTALVSADGSVSAYSGGMMGGMGGPGGGMGGPGAGQDFDQMR